MSSEIQKISETNKIANATLNELNAQVTMAHWISTFTFIFKETNFKIKLVSFFVFFLLLIVWCD